MSQLSYPFRKGLESNRLVKKDKGEESDENEKHLQREYSFVSFRSQLKKRI